MKLEEYDKSIIQLVNSIYENKGKNSQLMLEYAKQLFAIGKEREDDMLVGYGYYYMGEAYYGMNDGKNCFRCISDALHILYLIEDWYMVTCCYIYLGISSSNRGNVALALDYNLNGLRYSRKHVFDDLTVVGYINMGAISMNYGRYAQAQYYMEKAREILLRKPDMRYYQNYMLSICCILIKSMILQNRLEEAAAYIDEANAMYIQYGDNTESLSLYLVEALYNHKMEYEKEFGFCMQKIDELMGGSFSVMDIFDDVYEYALVLIEVKQDEYFQNIVDRIEPEVKKLNINNISRRFIALKMNYYMACGDKMRYLEQADRFYQLTVLMEEDNRDMMDTVLKLWSNFEKENEEKVKVEKENRILQIKSEQDPLTGLANRFSLNDYSDNALARTCTEHKSLAVEILDIDFFKEYNDNYGHQAGDECLKKVAEAISTLTEEHNGFCARYGGDEFVMIYEGISREEMLGLAQKLKERVASLRMEHRFSEAGQVVSISQGICWEIPEKRNQMWDFLHAADNMLYRIKKGGRNNYGLTDMHENESNMVIGKT
ncbi:MAG: GGDEF domain-containing protein [Lachnospiraceae bacterium]